MAKKRISLPAEIIRRIKIEAGYKCGLPLCNDKTGLQIHHIDSNPANSGFENLLLLCANHHSQATAGDVDAKACRLIKSLLKTSAARLNSSVKEIKTRKEFIDVASRYLAAGPRCYRATVVGPLMLHPTFLVQRRDAIAQHPNYERQIFEFIQSRADTRCHDIRLIFRNSVRYKQKVEALLNASERQRFIDGVLENVYAIWGKELDRGPDVCCLDPGFFKVELIYDDAMIAGTRASALAPISAGTLFTDLTDVERERALFDDIFDRASRGQLAELDALIKFVQSLW